MKRLLVCCLAFLFLLFGWKKGVLAEGLYFNFVPTEDEIDKIGKFTPVEPAKRDYSLLMDFHFALGTISLATFGTALILGASSGNLGKLTDPEACCPDGGDRIQGIRSVDRVLVTIGIASYLGAGGIALYNLLFEDPVEHTGRSHNAHRWLAIAHLVVFTVSATTGIIMSSSQGSDPERFATAAKIHTASNLVLIPLLSVALTDILLD
jgi:hypothetical protein